MRIKPLMIPTDTGRRAMFIREEEEPEGDEDDEDVADDEESP